MTRFATPDPRFRAWLAAQVPPLPDGLLDRSMGRIVKTRQDRGWIVRWPALRFATPVVGAAVVVVAVIVGGLLLTHLPGQVVGPPPTGTPTASGEPSSEPSSLPSPGTSPALPAPIGFPTWARIDLPDPAPSVYGGGTPAGIVQLAGRFVAVGSINAACCADGDPSLNHGVVWTSNDGKSWTVHAKIAAFAHATLTGVLFDGTRLIATGSYAEPVAGRQGISAAAVWVSTDGTSWTRATDPAPTYVAITPRGLVGILATGWSPGSDSTVAFVVSSDGLTWTPTSSTFAVAARGMAVGDGGHLIAVGVIDGTPLGDGTPTTDMVVWRSDDGSTWSEPQTVPDTLPVAVTADPQGFLVAGFRADQVSRLWRLGEGGLTTLPLALGDAETIDAIYAIGDALVVIGSAPTTAGVWCSLDGGSTWARVPDQPAFAGMNNELSSVVGTADGLVAVGMRWDPKTSHPVPEVWFSSRAD
jgi:hypothetical protein